MSKWQGDELRVSAAVNRLRQADSLATEPEDDDDDDLEEDLDQDLGRRRRRRSPSLLGPEREQVLGERFRNIVSQFRSRARRAKQSMQRPPSPESLTDVEEDLAHGGGQGQVGTAYEPCFEEAR